MFDPSIGRWITEDPLGRHGGRPSDLYKYATAQPARASADSAYEGWYTEASREKYYKAPDNPHYLDPATKQWSSSSGIDPHAGDSNLYRYVRNQPTNHRDPSGLDVYLVRTYDSNSSGTWVGSHHTVVVVTSDNRIITYDGAGPQSTDKLGYPKPWRNNKRNYDLVRSMMHFVDGRLTFKENPNIPADQIHTKKVYPVETPFTSWQNEAEALEYVFQQMVQKKYHFMRRNSNAYAHAMLKAAGMRVAEFNAWRYCTENEFDGVNSLPDTEVYSTRRPWGAVGWNRADDVYGSFISNVGTTSPSRIPPANLLFFSNVHPQYSEYHDRIGASN